MALLARTLWVRAHNVRGRVLSGLSDLFISVVIGVSDERAGHCANYDVLVVNNSRSSASAPALSSGSLRLGQEKL